MTTQALRPAMTYPLVRLGRGLRSASEAVARWRTRSRTHDALRHLDDRMLKDIGIEVIHVPDGVLGRSVVHAYRVSHRR